MKSVNLKTINIGNFIDFVEFSMFSSLMPLISKELFGGSSAQQATSLLYLLFFIGFLGRPFGAFVFGLLGDKFGRRKALMISILGMSVSTFALSLVPACFMAHYIIGIIRFAQGIFTGGEYANATVFVIEGGSKDTTYKNAANLTAFGIFGASVGQVIGMLVASETLPFLTWRSAFAFVSLMSLVVALNRAFRLPEITHQIEKKRRTIDIQYKYIVQGILFGGLMNGFFYLIYTFFGTYSSLNSGKIFMGNYTMAFFSSLLLGGMLILCSRISLLKARNPNSVLRIGLLGMLIFIYPLYSFFSTSVFNIYSCLCLVVFLFFMQMTTLIILSCFPKQFPAGNRVFFSGLSISIGNSVIGGSSPYISSKIVELTSKPLYPVFYFFILLSIVLFIAFLIPIKVEELRNESV